MLDESSLRFLLEVFFFGDFKQDRDMCKTEAQDILGCRLAIGLLELRIFVVDIGSNVASIPVTY